MSDRESQQASIDASEASLPAENGSREVANDPPSLGRAEESVRDAGVAARTRFQRRLQNDFYHIAIIRMKTGAQRGGPARPMYENGPNSH